MVTIHVAASLTPSRPNRSFTVLSINPRYSLLGIPRALEAFIKLDKMVPLSHRLYLYPRALYFQVLLQMIHVYTNTMGLLDISWCSDLPDDRSAL